MVRRGGFNFRVGRGEDSEGCEVQSGICEDNDNFSSLRKSRLDSSSLVGAIYDKGAVENAFVPFDIIVNDIFSLMVFCVG